MKGVEKVIGKPKLTTLMSFSLRYGKITMYRRRTVFKVSLIPIFRCNGGNIYGLRKVVIGTIPELACAK